MIKEMIFYIHNGANYELYAQDYDKVLKFKREIGEENILLEKYLTKFENEQRLKIIYDDGLNREVGI